MISTPQAGQHVIPESCTLALLDLLPSVECLSPQQALQLMKTRTESKSSLKLALIPVQYFVFKERTTKSQTEKLGSRLAQMQSLKSSCSVHIYFLSQMPSKW